jgi:hypothetical protein
MPKLQVTHYRVEWNPLDNKGKVYVQIAGYEQATEVPIDSVEEFIAVMLMMSKAPVFVDTETRDFECGPLPVGT